MDCCEFREKYSDFADGLLSQAVAAEARRHLALCGSCQRFDAALREGVRALRALPPLSVSRGFGERLRRRLRWELSVRMPLVDRWSGAVGALLLLVTVGFVAIDLMEARGPRDANRAVPAVATRPKPARRSARVAPVRPPADTTVPPLDTPHPFQPIMVVADTITEPFPAHVRLDVPAVWGGR
jgi:anti-sigma factor RsiW